MPGSPGSPVPRITARAIAAVLAPHFRVLSLESRLQTQPVELCAADLVAVLDTFGFRRAILLGQRRGLTVARLAARWRPERVRVVIPLDRSA